MLLFAWVVSNGDIEAPTAYVHGTPVHGIVFRLTYGWQRKLDIAVYVLGLLWGLETITAVFQFVMCYAVVIWYFQPCKPDFSKPKVPSMVWSVGIKTAIRYHMGSLALSASIVGFFRLLHTLLEFIAKQAHNDSNMVGRLISHTCMCCIWCYEEIVRYINKNAVIEMVLHSTDFFTSAGAAIRRIAEADSKVAALSGITVVFQTLGTTCITAFGAYVSWLFVSSQWYSVSTSEWFLDTPMVVVVVAGFLSFLVAASFMFIFDMTSDTLLFCWLADGEDGTTEYAPKPLRDLMDLIGAPKIRTHSGDHASDF